DASGILVTDIANSVRDATDVNSGLFQVEIIRAGDGDDVFDIAANGTSGLLLNGNRGSDDYIITAGPGLVGNVDLLDIGDTFDVDRLFFFGTENPDEAGMTELALFYRAGGPEGPLRSIGYAPPLGVVLPECDDPDINCAIERLLVDLKGDNDVFNIESTNDTTTVEVLGGAGDDIVRIGVRVNAPLDADGNRTVVEQNLNFIRGSAETGPLVVQGNAGFDQIFLFDTTDVLDNQDETQGDVMFNVITGLGMTTTVSYTTFENLEIQLGLGNDTLDIESTHSGTNFVFGGPANDIVNVKTIDGLTTVDGEDGDDVFNVHNDGLLTDQINRLLTIIGGDNDGVGDILNVDDSNETFGNFGVLTGDSLIGLDMGYNGNFQDPAEIANADANGIRYSLIETMNIDLGSGDDLFNVQGTSAVTNLRGHDGDDAIYVSSIANVRVDGDKPQYLGGTLDDVVVELNIDAGANDNQLMISDADATVGDSNIIITNATVEGLAPALITYTAADNTGNYRYGITIWSGSGDDTALVDSTSIPVGQPTLRNITTLNTGAGDDVVTVDLDDVTDGFFDVNTQQDDDTVLATTSTLPLVVFGGLGYDIINAGQNDDIIFGDRGRVHYFDAGVLDTVLGGGGPGDFTNGVVLDRGLLFTTDPLLGAADIISGQNGDDIILGGLNRNAAPFDIFSYADPYIGAPATQSRNVDRLEGNAGNDLILGDHGMLDFLINDNDASTLDVMRSSDPLNGGADLIIGGDDQDIIFGGTAQDAIFGGNDHDILLGDHGEYNTAFSDNQRFLSIFITDADGGAG
ncbi:MAG: hypothetical protein KC983_04815, partial [Phycisphaerales bacterium]|nr:hypothetical protein [Phycisphaerales bacterium]